MLDISGLSHTYGQASIDFPEWKVKKEDHAIILGNSGSGKTTLLHLIGGLMQPKNGKIEVNGTEVTALSGTQLDQFRGKNIGIVFQKPHLIQSLTVKENILLAQMLGARNKDAKKIDHVLEDLAIKDLANRKVFQISQGQAQRVSIARAIINDPMLLLADEPTASLDDENCERVLNLLLKEAEQTGATLIVATHDQRIKEEFKNQLVL